MPRKARYNIPTLIWRCPHCGFEHTAADLMRLDFNNLRCKTCGEAFPSGPGEGQEMGLAEGASANNKPLRLKTRPQRRGV